MSKFKELVKTIIKEAGNYPDDFNSFAFDARYGDNEKLDMLEEAYAVKIEKGTIINDANSDVNNPFIINDGKFYVAKTNNNENINRFGLFEVTEDLISKYETSDYYSVFDTKDEANEVLNSFKELNPDVILEIIVVYGYQGENYSDNPEKAAEMIN